ncbi:riboflavin synthase [Pseudahrensia aquimaris]|uniref:Riboflavin synthase n=1 Tax=Pseudahrensia aquimaris TaxID=744461 RepID=A0ABW3FAX5_9HYPH
MFTGIITAIGTIEHVEELSQGKRYRIASEYDTSTIDMGASIAHDGVCLTVVEKTAETYSVEAWEEALRLTTAANWAEGSKLNLERALRIGDELGGHIVSGHVDGMAHIVEMETEGDATRYTIDAPEDLARFIAPKGSIALNGTSLTVNNVGGTRFDVLLIRHSQEVTTWGQAKVGDALNIEVDTMARYAARLAEFPSSSK